MENANPMDNLLLGLGAICELAGLMRDNLMKNGFTREEAVDMAKWFMDEAFKRSLNGK